MQDKPLDRAEQELLSLIRSIHAETGPVERGDLTLAGRGRGLEVARPLNRLKHLGLIEEYSLQPSWWRRLFGARGQIMLRPAPEVQTEAPSAAETADLSSDTAASAVPEILADTLPAALSGARPLAEQASQQALPEAAPLQRNDAPAVNPLTQSRAPEPTFEPSFEPIFTTKAEPMLEPLLEPLPPPEPFTIHLAVNTPEPVAPPPAPAPVAEPSSDDALQRDAAPDTLAEPEAAPEAAVAHEPEAAAEITAETAPELAPETAPELVAEQAPEPEPEPEPQAEPEPEPQVALDAAASPEQEREQEPAAVAAAATALPDATAPAPAAAVAAPVLPQQSRPPVPASRPVPPGYSDELGGAPMAWERPTQLMMLDPDLLEGLTEVLAGLGMEMTMAGETLIAVRMDQGYSAGEALMQLVLFAFCHAAAFDIASPQPAQAEDLHEYALAVLTEMGRLRDAGEISQERFDHDEHFILRLSDSTSDRSALVAEIFADPVGGAAPPALLPEELRAIDEDL